MFLTNLLIYQCLYYLLCLLLKLSYTFLIPSPNGVNLKSSKTDNNFLKNLQKHLIAIVLFIRDEDNVIYLGIIMIILSVLICFFNISRSYGNSGSGEVATKS